MKERLTEKRMSDRRFRRTEEAILKAFFEGDSYVSIGVMAERAGVARSTFYRHHKTVGMILPDYKKYILRRYRRFVGTLKGNRVGLRIVIMKIPVFILSNRNAFRTLNRCGDREVIREMIVYLKPKIVRAARLPKNHEMIYKVYVGEVVELVNCWVKGGGRDAEMERLIDDIEYLTRTMRKRLLPVEK